MALSSVIATARVRNRILAFFCLVFFALAYLLFTHTSISSPLSFVKSNPHLMALIQATKALTSVEDRFNRRLKYPYVLFTSEDEVPALTDEIKAKIHYITEGRATFATTTKESWDVPTHLDMARVNASLQNIGFRLGYRSMCRFYSGFFWRHPALAPYDWFCGLDTDIVFHCEVVRFFPYLYTPQSVITGFVQVSGDTDFVQPSLASNRPHFSNANHGFVWNDAASVERAFSGIAGIDDWTRMCMYNNFEISHRNVWESTLYTKFFEYLDKAGGFFYERWGDAPEDQALQFHDMGYQHQGWPYECPQELDRCTCEREGVAAMTFLLFHSIFKRVYNSWFGPDV
ncbi:nucleotide-diphospho-sugar transferase [Cyathus striatus]|nr:nucleotide-diphospho-sugar transferase [Cyathus striatus]